MLPAVSISLSVSIPIASLTRSWHPAPDRWPPGPAGRADPAILGTGEQARAHAHALPRVRPIRTVLVEHGPDLGCGH
jgi:hypothetical protein